MTFFIYDISQRMRCSNTMAQLIDGERNTILKVNKKDLEAYNGDDLAHVDRLKVDDAKNWKRHVLPYNIGRAEGRPIWAWSGAFLKFFLPMKMGCTSGNKTAPFGTVLSFMNPDPSYLEAAAIRL